MSKLWRIEHYGPGPVGALVQADTSSAALALFLDHLEGYEGCYRDTGSQHIELFEPEHPGILHIELRQV